MTEIISKFEPIIKEAGKIILSAHDINDQTASKEGTANFVTTYDVAVQKYLYEKLAQVMPDANFIGEESDCNHSELLKSGYSFIIDPIDGTTNFIQGCRHSSISVGLSFDNEIIAGAVYNPYTDEMFTAEKGYGAYLNGKRIRTSERHISDALVAFGSSPYYRELADESFDILKYLYLRTRDIRRSGSAALDLSYVACGRYDLFYEARLSPWDYAAGSIIIKEAGGDISSMSGEKLTLDRPSSVLAGNQYTFGEYFNLIKQRQS